MEITSTYCKILIVQNDIQRKFPIKLSGPLWRLYQYYPFLVIFLPKGDSFLNFLCSDCLLYALFCTLIFLLNKYPGDCFTSIHIKLPQYF